MNWNKWMAGIGFGTTEIVDIHLEKDAWIPGSQITGEVLVKGQENQKIQDVYFTIITQYLKRDKLSPYISENYQLSKEWVLQSEQTERIPFHIQLPISLPMSTGRFPITMKATLDVPMAIDPTYEKKITMYPVPTVQRVLSDIENAGFILYKIVNLQQGQSDTQPFHQSFQFKPTGSHHGIIDEFHVIFDYHEIGIHIDMEMIRADQSFYTSFEWQHNHPTTSLLINGNPESGDPFTRLQELFART